MTRMLVLRTAVEIHFTQTSTIVKFLLVLLVSGRFQEMTTIAVAYMLLRVDL